MAFCGNCGSKVVGPALSPSQAGVGLTNTLGNASKFLFTAFILIAGIMGWIITCSGPSRIPDSATGSQSPALNIAVERVEYLDAVSDKDGDVRKPRAGNHWCVGYFTVRAQGGSVSFIPVNVKLIDNQGNMVQYDDNTHSLAHAMEMVMSLTPAEKLSGMILYQIPKETKAVRFRYDEYGKSFNIQLPQESIVNRQPQPPVRTASANPYATLTQAQSGAVKEKHIQESQEALAATRTKELVVVILLTIDEMIKKNVSFNVVPENNIHAVYPNYTDITGTAYDGKAVRLDSLTGPSIVIYPTGGSILEIEWSYDTNNTCNVTIKGLGDSAEQKRKIISITDCRRADAVTGQADNYRKNFAVVLKDFITR